jgi:manganese/zinc/iron transport system substrate-binding protein
VLRFFVTSRLVALRGLGTIFTVLFFAGCDSGDSDGTLVVVSTTTHVTDMVKFVAGDRLEVIALMGPGVDPHLYKPSAGDAATLAKADLILYKGLMLEGRMVDVFAKVSRRGTKTYAVTETVSEELLLEPKEFEGHWDPHVWFDPEIWSECIEVVRDALSENDPAGKAGYAERAETLKTQYLAVTHWAQSRISELPEESRYLVTSHDAFNYFGRAFGMKVLAVQGVSTATEAGLADRVAMVDFVKEHGVKAIFVESSVNPAIIKGIAKEAGVRIGGELFSDAMGQPGRLEQGPDGEQYDIGTWVGMMKHNVNAIVEGLK